MAASWFRCPVCGFGELPWRPYDDFGLPSFEICPCCGTQFGVEDARQSHELLRHVWAVGGARWWSLVEPPPVGWDPAIQLSEFGPDSTQDQPT